MAVLGGRSRRQPAMDAAPAAPCPLQQEVEQLYCSHHGWLRATLQRKLGNAADAADLAHDVYARILMRRQPIRAAEPRAFLTTVAQRVVIDHWRRRELEQAWLDSLAAQPQAVVMSPEQRALILETLTAVDAALDRLRPAVREAFLLNHLEGLSCPRIAERLGISLATAERHVAKALRACYAVHFES